MHPRPRSTGTARDAMAGFGVLALAAVCCAGLPLIAAIAGALALCVLVSIAAAAIAVAAIAGALTIRARRRRDGVTQRACAGIVTSASPTASDEQLERRHGHDRAI